MNLPTVSRETWKMVEMQLASPELGQEIKKLDYDHKYSLVDNEGRRFLLTMKGWNEVEIETGGLLILASREDNGRNPNKTFKVKTDIGWFYPMRTQIEQVFKGYLHDRSVGNVWRHARLVAEEYREFLAEMERVAE